MAAFKVAAFEEAEQEEPAARVANSRNAGEFWGRLLRPGFGQTVEKEQGSLGKGRRERKQVCTGRWAHLLVIILMA